MLEKNTSVSFRIILNYVILIFIFSILLIIYSCKNNPETPAEDLPGRRDYMWTVDTLKATEGGVIPLRIWGTGPNNVWAVGMAYLNEYCIWHFDGNKWKNYVPDKYVNPEGLYGFADNDIWLSSTDGSFWHFDGSRWSKFCKIQIEGYNNIIIEDINGKSSNDAYAVGFADSIDGNSYKAIMMHFDGSKWLPVNIPNMKNSFVQIYYDENTSLYLIYALIFNEPVQIVYTFDGMSLQKIFTNQDFFSLTKIGKNIYASVHDKLYKYNDSNFIMAKDLSSINCAGISGGRSEHDFFTFNYDGIGHYNGTDLTTIFEKLNTDWSPLTRILVFAKDVFSIWDDSNNTFIVHGKLK